MLTIVGGPMFAGKTTWLVNHIQQLPAGTYQLFKPLMDVRYATDACVTHSGLRWPAMNLDTQRPVFPEVALGVQTLLIDELNFFQADTLWRAIRPYLETGKHVIGCGLFLDVKKQPFGATLELASKADQVVTLQAICDRCSQPADHSYSKVQMAGQVRLGAGDTYGACCTSCWDVLQI